jgi:outer membrane receptor protein involved in Fe transport
MRNSFPCKHNALALAIMLAGTTLPVFAQQNTSAAQQNTTQNSSTAVPATNSQSTANTSTDDAAVEEVLVTGSFIRSSPLDAPSPVVVVDRNSIEAQGAAIIWDVIKNLEVNSGSITNPGSGDNTQVAGSANVNLRNLGENSTLTLINGRRQVSAALNTRSGGELVDLNTIPLVMTDRIEVLTDGGSALYGADAVAGVVNTECGLDPDVFPRVRAYHP